MLGTYFRVTYQKLPLSTTKFFEISLFCQLFCCLDSRQSSGSAGHQAVQWWQCKNCLSWRFFPLMYLMIRCQALITFNPFAKKFRWTTAPSHLVSITPCVSSSNPTCLIKLAIITTRLTYTWPSLALSTFYQLADHHAHVSSSDHDALF